MTATHDDTNAPMHGMWGGRFASGLDPQFAEFNRSLGFDARLLEEDVRGSIAWANALAEASVLTSTEAAKIIAGLEEIAQAPLPCGEHEDVHSYVEHELGKRCGELAGKLHTGRSRNDQVALDIKLFLRSKHEDLVAATTQLITALVLLADENVDVAIPGDTHRQRAQPITVGHYLLAFAEMLARDRSRLVDCGARMNTCPLGSGALAGTGFPIDRESLAAELDFAAPTRNSLDAVSDRDHSIETIFACSSIMLHLSRLADDWIFFASYEAGFLEFPDAVATGSSLMPQKKNPDAMELVRGKTGRVIGSLQSLLVTMKGLPLAYNKDMQEDKEVLFDAIDTTLGCLAVTTTVVRGAQFDIDRCQAAASTGHMTATDVADLLVGQGVPFREAHERTGRAVRKALELGVELDALPDSDASALLPELGPALPSELTVSKSLERHRATGGTAPTRVRVEVDEWKRRLEHWQS